MIMVRRICKVFFALVIVFASAGIAYADAIMTFTSSAINTVAGGIVEFDGTLTNTGTSDLYLNGDVVILNYPDLTVDDSPFFADSPLFLSPGGFYSGAFIDVTADAETLFGSYSGSYTIQGGANSNTFNDIATTDFAINIDPSTITPEPNPFLLQISGLLILAVLRSVRRPLASS